MQTTKSEFRMKTGELVTAAALLAAAGKRVIVVFSSAGAARRALSSLSDYLRSKVPGNVSRNGVEYWPTASRDNIRGCVIFSYLGVREQIMGAPIDYLVFDVSVVHLFPSPFPVSREQLTGDWRAVPGFVSHLELSNAATVTSVSASTPNDEKPEGGWGRYGYISGGEDTLPKEHAEKPLPVFKNTKSVSIRVRAVENGFVLDTDMSSLLPRQEFVAENLNEAEKLLRHIAETQIDAIVRHLRNAKHKQAQLVEAGRK